MKKKVLAIVVIFTFVLTLFNQPVANVQAKNYTIKDIKQSDESYEVIQQVLGQGWMNLTLGKFYPDKNITRGEFALILTKFNNQLNDAKKISKSTFKDVDFDYKYSKYIELQRNYIAYSKTSFGKYFKPKNYITREDALVALVKTLGYNSSDAIENGMDSEIDLEEIIADSDKVTTSMKSYVTLGVVAELIDLIEKDEELYLNPRKFITRKQLALLLVNANNSKNYNDIEDEDSTATSSPISSLEVHGTGAKIYYNYWRENLPFIVWNAEINENACGVYFSEESNGGDGYFDQSYVSYTVNNTSGKYKTLKFSAATDDSYDYDCFVDFVVQTWNGKWKVLGYGEIDEYLRINDLHNGFDEAVLDIRAFNTIKVYILAFNKQYDLTVDSNGKVSTQNSVGIARETGIIIKDLSVE